MRNLSGLVALATDPRRIVSIVFSCQATSTDLIGRVVRSNGNYVTVCDTDSVGGGTVRGPVPSTGGPHEEPAISRSAQGGRCYLVNSRVIISVQLNTG